MGACTFTQVGKGKNAREAFFAAQTEARYLNGNGGYTGTLAEKHEFIMITPPEDVDIGLFIRELLDNDDIRISDKWGPAGCIKIGIDEYLFFGWASL